MGTGEYKPRGKGRREKSELKRHCDDEQARTSNEAEHGVSVDDGGGRGVFTHCC